MGFLAVLNWMLNHTPGFMRPAVSWLLDGLRKITAFISSRWNWLGQSVGRFFQAVTAFRAALWGLVSAIWRVSAWVVRVYVPRVVAAARAAILRAVDLAMDKAVKALNAVIATLRHLTKVAIDAVRGALSDLRAWALARVNELFATLAALIRSLLPILNGPAVLAEWLVGALWSAFGRYLFRQRDRVAHWLLDGSPVFTRWLASTMESIIVRWLS